MREAEVKHIVLLNLLISYTSSKHLLHQPH